MLLEIAICGFAHSAFDVITASTDSPADKVQVWNTEPVSLGTGVLFIRHWYAGATPPLVGVNVKVTQVPSHTGIVGRLVILTAGITTGFTAITTVFEVALAGLAQGEFDVILATTKSALFNVQDVKLLPDWFGTGEPFIVHPYTGLLPPLVGVAVKVTQVPAHIGPDGLADIATVAAADEPTLIVVVVESVQDPLEATKRIIYVPGELNVRETSVAVENCTPFSFHL